MSDSLLPLDPIVGAAEYWHPVSAVFTCDQCGSVAGTVTLVPPMASDPLAPPPGTPGAVPGRDMLFAEHVRVSVDGPVRLTQTLFEGAQDLVEPLDAALRAGDPDALYEVNPEFAPFRCRACAKSYCKSCWRTWVTFADDFPGWHEDTKGMCPSGHIRILETTRPVTTLQLPERPTGAIWGHLVGVPWSREFCRSLADWKATSNSPSPTSTTT